MSLSFMLFSSAAFVMLIIFGVGVYLSKRGVFKKTEQAAVQAVTQDVQNVAAKVVPPTTPPTP